MRLREFTLSRNRGVYVLHPEPSRRDKEIIFLTNVPDAEAFIEAWNMYKMLHRNFLDSTGAPIYPLVNIKKPDFLSVPRQEMRFGEYIAAITKINAVQHYKQQRQEKGF